VIGTLGKALGSYGAYACASSEIVRLLINTARPLIFSTAPAPPAVAGALAALELLQQRPERVERLRANARTLRRALAEEGFPVAEGEIQIVPLLVGEESLAMDLCQHALDDGVFAQAIRPPTVPEGTSRLRLTAMATHRPAELRRAAAALGAAARRLGLDPAALAEPHQERVPLQAVESWRMPTWEPRAAAGSSAAGAPPFDLERDSASEMPFDLERDSARSARAA